jgi:hypothetical protein
MSSISDSFGGACIQPVGVPREMCIVSANTSLTKLGCCSGSTACCQTPSSSAAAGGGTERTKVPRPTPAVT